MYVHLDTSVSKPWIRSLVAALLPATGYMEGFTCSAPVAIACTPPSPLRFREHGGSLPRLSCLYPVERGNTLKPQGYTEKVFYGFLRISV